jgi:putative spermidine/putrescine transport system substrate-binding protein
MWQLLRVVPAVVALVLVSACGGEQAAEQKPSEAAVEKMSPWQGPISDAGGVLTIVAPLGYAESGETKKDIDWVTPFEEETGCDVNVVSYNRSDQVVQFVNDGGYDVVAVPSDATGRLFATDSLQPLNTNLVENFEAIVPALRQTPWNTFDSAIYGISDGRGANLLQYHTKVFKKPPPSWGVSWKPDPKHQGKVAILDTPMQFASAALYLMKEDPSLGITNPFALDANQFGVVRDLVLQQKLSVGEYWADYARQLDEYKAGSLVVGDGWQVTANLAKARKIPVAVTKPTEGATGWSVTWMIPAKAANLNCAYKWLDWVVSPEVNAAIAEWVGQAPANLDSCSLTDDPLHCQQFRARDAEFWADIFIWRTPTSACLDGRSEVECVPYDEWARSWFELRAAG